LLGVLQAQLRQGPERRLQALEQRLEEATRPEPREEVPRVLTVMKPKARRRCQRRAAGQEQ
jgi:hypothetical protein